jgi:hypothetical protein
MFGLQTDAAKCQITLAPHVPADWTSFAIRNVRAGDGTIDFQYRKTSGTIVLETRRTGPGDCAVDFSPAFSLRTDVLGAELNGRSVTLKTEPNANDKHASVHFALSGGTNTLVIRVKNDFGLGLSSELPALGSASRGLRVLSESWNTERTELTLELSGAEGNQYEFEVWNPGQISSAEGGLLTKLGKLQIQMPHGVASSYSQQKLILHFDKSR